MPAPFPGKRADDLAAIKPRPSPTVMRRGRGPAVRFNPSVKLDATQVIDKRSASRSATGGAPNRAI